nr:MAG TPA: hypothetical protein [Caudoviricetes sp.]
MANKKIEQKVNKTEQETKTKKEETIKILIPIDKLNPEDKEIIVGINEKYAKIVRGEETDVTRPVFEQLRNAGLV